MAASTETGFLGSVYILCLSVITGIIAHMSIVCITITSTYLLRRRDAIIDSRYDIVTGSGFSVAQTIAGTQNIGYPNPFTFFNPDRLSITRLLTVSFSKPPSVSVPGSRTISFKPIDSRAIDMEARVSKSLLEETTTGQSCFFTSSPTSFQLSLVAAYMSGRFFATPSISKAALSAFESNEQSINGNLVFSEASFTVEANRSGSPEAALAAIISSFRV